MSLEKAYNPKKYESKIYQAWEESGYFNPDKLPNERKETYTIMIAPPNITGELHMGHALENTLLDIIIRRQRMRGYKTLWLPGTDHAGISTQSIVENELAKKGIRKDDIGREKFLEYVWQRKEKYGNMILNQLKKLGFSLDWSRTAFTMDENYQEAVNYAFEHYRKKGWIYQGKRVINWSVKDQTALSDLEIYYKEQKDTLWYIKYHLVEDPKKYIIVATVRPETMLGDTAVAVNPKDTRYKDLVGKKAIVPIVEREILIIADDAVKKEFGTGAVKVTPAHNTTDFEISERHKLEVIEVIDRYGKIIEAFEPFAGLKVKEARKKVIEKLQKLNLIEKTEDYTHNVAYGERCHTVIEPRLSNQWFVAMNELAKKTIAAIERGEVQYHPAKWKDVALEWLKNIRDWNISRQIWWGHPVPVEGSTDVLDTWFSSALWPFATLGWPKETDELKNYYPTNVITSAREIIHLWMTRMIFSGLEFTGQVPFKDIIVHETILTKDGKRMSKSLGTGINPLDYVEQYGADATRFGLVWQAMGTQDIRWDETAIVAGKKFLNKIWNATRLVLAREPDEIDPEAAFTPAAEHNQKIISSFWQTHNQFEQELKDYEFGPALHTIYDFFWHTFCDKFLETSKEHDDRETTHTLLVVLANSLKLLHPFEPFLTEALWQQLPIKNKTLLIVEPWPISKKFPPKVDQPLAETN